ncbi:MAG: preprotein translocase subunit YajC [Flavobacterium sp.]|jgi:preprotein translocase subunit YajC|nr:preprotein translocase subunit YajC [Flavobacterium sp.]MBT6378526.1 preprotein translocase subunit YajC [Flavobacterium sp.]
MILTTLFLQASPSEGFGGMMLPMLALLVVFYLFMILPQNRKRKKEKKFITELKKGSKVVTSSGIHGKLVDINDKDTTVTIETGAGKIKFEQAAISVELSKKYTTAPAKK